MKVGEKRKLDPIPYARASDATRLRVELAPAPASRPNSTLRFFEVEAPAVEARS